MISDIISEPSKDSPFFSVAGVESIYALVISTSLELPIDPSSLTRWRKRLGPDKVAELLVATIQTAQEKKLLTEKHIERVNVDTTVQEKAISFPTDARLYHKARRTLVKLARKNNIDLRQSYERVGKRA